MQNPESVKRLVEELGKGKKFPALKLISANPDAAAVVSKLVSPVDQGGFNPQKERSHYSLNQGQLQTISESTKNRITDNENILQLFPDIELAVQILISSIQSPKDMVKTDLIYKSKENIFSSELLMKMNNIVKSHLEGHYDVKNEINAILRDTLFETGSYIKAVIPESSVDEIINKNTTVSTESLKELFTSDNKVNNLGFLGNPGNRTKKHSLESFFSNNTAGDYMSNPVIEHQSNKFVIDTVEVTDNFKLLKLPQILKVHNERKAKALIKSKPFSMAFESHKITDVQFAGLVYKSPNRNAKEFVAIPTKQNAKRKSVGRPLVMKLPSESVIPICIPGDESNHIGYFVLIDIDGNPITRFSNQNYIDGLSTLMASCSSGNNSLAGSLLAKAKSNLADNSKTVTLDRITEVYASIIENDLIQRLNNGIYGSNVRMLRNEEIYRIMLARSFAGQYTRLVFIPKELVTYFAFSFYPNGVGKSYLDNIKNLTSLRAILLFAKVMAMVKSSIALTKVNIKLDPSDPDPQKTIEIAQHEVARLRQSYFPLGINSPVDLVDWIQKAGLEFQYEGHPGIPETSFDFESKNIQHVQPDSELDELLRKQTYMSFGLSPEMMDNGFNPEFATSVVSNNILLSKRILQLQNIFCADLTNYVRNLIDNDIILRQELLELVEQNMGVIEKSLSEEEKEVKINDLAQFQEDIIDRYTDNFEIELPKPDVTTLQNQSEAFEGYTEALEKAIDSWIHPDIIPESIFGSINTNIDGIKNIVKAYYIRRWMSDNGYLTELGDLVTTDEEGKPNIDVMQISKDHIDGLIRSCLKLIKDSKPIQTAADQDLENLGTPEGSSSSSSSDDSSSSSGDGDSFGGDDFGGMDDFGGGDTGAPTDQVPSDETTPDANTDDNKPEETPTE